MEALNDIDEMEIRDYASDVRIGGWQRTLGKECQKIGASGERRRLAGASTPTTSPVTAACL